MALEWEGQEVNSFEWNGAFFEGELFAKERVRVSSNGGQFQLE